MCDPSRTRSFCIGLLTGLLFGIVFGLAYPPVNIWWLVVLAPLPLVICATHTTAPLWTALGVSLGSLPMWTLHHLWIASISTLGIIPLVIYLSIWPGLFVLILSRLARVSTGLVWVLAPIVWTGLEVLRAEVVWHGYPWFLLAHPLIEYEWMARWASVGGVYLLSFILCAQTAIFGWLIFARKRSKLSWNLALLCMCMLTFAPILLHNLSSSTATSSGTERIRIGVVQTSVPQTIRGTWTLDQRIEEMRTLMMLTLEIDDRARDTDIIIWPETMFPGPTLSPEAIAVLRKEYSALFTPDEADLLLLDTALLTLSEQVQPALIVGARGYEGFRIERDEQSQTIFEADRSYNSTFVVSNGVITPQRYDKMHLTPFGEVMPYLSAWAWLESKLLAIGAQGMSFDLDAGTDPTALVARIPDGREIRLATPICFEATVARVCRQLVFADGRRRADLMLNLTNDGWFGDHPGGREHHMLLARWRCIELATPMVRAANTGISAVIDSRGRVVERGPQWILDEFDELRPAAAGDEQLAGILVAEVELGTEMTPYGRVGDIVGWSSMAAAVALAGLAIFLPAGRGRRDEPMESTDQTQGVLP